MQDRNIVVSLANYDEDVCLLRIPLKTVSIIIVTFKIFCISVALLAFNRSIIYERREGLDVTVVWNGNIPTYCRVKNTLSFQIFVFLSF